MVKRSMILTEPMEIRLDAGDIKELRNDNSQFYLFGRNGSAISTGATEFFVVDDLGISRYALSTHRGVLTEREYSIYIQPQINNSPVFCGLNYRGNGLSNRVVPYPRNGIDKSIGVFNVLSGQHFDILVKTETKLKKSEHIYVFLKYTMYTGTESVFARQLDDLGRAVTPENIDWLRDETRKQ